MKSRKGSDERHFKLAGACSNSRCFKSRPLFAERKMWYYNVGVWKAVATRFGIWIKLFLQRETSVHETGHMVLTGLSCWRVAFFFFSCLLPRLLSVLFPPLWSSCSALTCHWLLSPGLWLLRCPSIKPLYVYAHVYRHGSAGILNLDDVQVWCITGDPVFMFLIIFCELVVFSWFSLLYFLAF